MLAVIWIIHKSLVAACLAAGLLMVAWGGRGFVGHRQATPIPGEEESAPRVYFDKPTIGDIADEYGVWVAARQLGCLAVAGLGVFVACGSFLRLIAREQSA